MGRRDADLLLVTAAIAVVTVVPDWSHRSLTDPSYWGVVGCLGMFLGVLALRRRAWDPGSANRRVIVTFLVAAPIIYVADWLRFGGSPLELAVEVVGLGLWVFLAVIARRSDLALWLGCALHGVWDAAHFGRVGFVPEWYEAACMAADIGLAAFVLIRVKEASSLRP